MPQDKQDVDLSSEFNGGVEIDASDRLKFARQVLIGITLICIGVFTAYAYFPDNSALKNIFEVLKIGALPLITLVVSFYFPSSKN